MHLFGKQSIAMTWDFPEAGILHETVGGFAPAAVFIADCIEKLQQRGLGVALQQDAMTSEVSKGKVISTDPPYYDNISYADLSDFFYVWLRHALKTIFPDLFATLGSPRLKN
jgi:putative DNA methylase